MEEKMTESEQKQYRRELFIKLLMMLRAGALQHLGQLTNPITGEKKPNLDLARETIDMIDLLQEKTSGNLSEQENDMLKSLLSELQLAYINTWT